MKISTTVQQFDHMPDEALADIRDAVTIARRSRASIYRHFKAGDLTPIKIGNSTRIRVGELRRLIGMPPNPALNGEASK
ncbi:MAG: helix-turn-helix domain-containing protein [Gallionellaceae bacterium]|nr:helix-turn-helix domain-containing protein [Gallionellaceae bacterium]